MLKFSTTPYQGRCAVHGGRNSLGTNFKGNTLITTFNELRYFKGLKTWEYQALGDCTNLTSVHLPAHMISTPNSIFRSDTRLSQVVLPPNLQTIGQWGFHSCPIIKIDLPATLTKIDTGAFYRTRLVSVTIPQKVTSIASSAFDVNTLTEIIFLGSTPPTVGNNGLGSNLSFPIYVPDDAVEAYKAALTTNNYASRVKPISERPTE